MKINMKFVILLIAPLLLSACATREYHHEYVKSQIAPLQKQMEQQRIALIDQSVHVDLLIKNNEALIRENTRIAQEALERASAIGKLSEGKFVYEARPVFHRTTFIDWVGAEPDNFRLYTYVILPLHVRKDTVAPSIFNRYQSLLEAIYVVNGPADSSDDLNKSNQKQKQNTNIFCIPGANPIKADAKELQNYYDFALGRLYKEYALKVIPATKDTDLLNLTHSLEHAPGPFLITTLRPLNKVKPGDSMLIANLSRSNPNAMQEFIESYRQHLNEKFNGIQSFKSLRLSLLSMLLDVDSSIQIIKIAVADQVSTFKDMSKIRKK